MEQDIANAVPFRILTQRAVAADAFVSVCVERFNWRSVCTHDPDVHHVPCFPVEAWPDEPCGYGYNGRVVDEAWAFIEHDAVVVAPCPLGADNVQLFSQLNDLSIELFQLCADFFLRRYVARLLSQ